MKLKKTILHQNAKKKTLKKTYKASERALQRLTNTRGNSKEFVDNYNVLSN